MGPKFCLVMGENTMFEMMRFQKSSGPEPMEVLITLAQRHEGAFLVVWPH